jgi:hypothetical protein
MAFNFRGDNWLQGNGTPVTGPPLTFSAWVRPPYPPSAAAMIIEVSNNTVAERFTLYYEPNFGFGIYQQGSGQGAAAYSPFISTGWYHVCGVISSNSLRKIYVNGVNNGAPATDTTAVTTTGVSAIRIGIRCDQNFGVNGDIAEVAVYDVALTDAEILGLARRFSPGLIRPQNLKMYLSLLREVQDVRANRLFTREGLTTVTPSPTTHPAIIF